MENIIILADNNKKKVKYYIEKNLDKINKIVKIQGIFYSTEDISSDYIKEKNIRYFIVLGGDGLILSSARFLVKNLLKIPVIGVNFGKLGFLAEWTEEELINELPKIIKGDCKKVSRIMIKCEVIRKNEVIYTNIGLNDIVIKTSVSRILYLSLFIDNENISNFGGDGIIIATPVGSTAYSLSAGGPILFPNLSEFLITPVCPHLLTLRPCIVSSSRSIIIKLLDPYPGKVTLTIDGQIHFDLKEKDIIKIYRNPENFYMVVKGNRSFIQILREKFTWGIQQLDKKFVNSL